MEIIELSREKKRRLRRVIISLAAIEHLLLSPGYKVFKSLFDLPETAVCIRHFIVLEAAALVLIYHDPSFDEVDDGEIIPSIDSDLVSFSCPSFDDSKAKDMSEVGCPIALYKLSQDE